MIRKLADSIEEEKQRKEDRIDWMQEEAREKRVHDHRKLFRALISEDLSSGKILSMAEGMNLDLSAPMYQIMLVYVFYKSDYRNQGLVEGLLMTITDCFEKCFLFEHSVDSEVILITGKTAQDLEQKADQIRESNR